MKVASIFAAVALACIAAASPAQTVNLTAKASNLVLPDGQAVPMWGFACNDVGAGSASCAAANATAAGGWSPVVITVPTGSNLTINLTNSLPVPPGAAAASGIPTSLVIVGQLGGGLGAGGAIVASPPHNTQNGTTWPIAGGNAKWQPPAQPNRIQSFGTEVATGQTAALTWSNLKPGTYLIESGTHPSIQGPMGLYGVLVVTTAATTTAPGTAYPNVKYNAELPLLLSEIDPVQNNAVAKAVTLPGFSETAVWSGQPGGCGNPGTTNSGNCYPPAVNYAPTYYLMNGVSFDRTALNSSTFPVAPTGAVSGNLLVRFVNAGLKMHVPSIVGATTGTPAVGGFSLIAEDGNPLPGVPRIQNEVFLAAGKTYDVMMNVPVATSPAIAPPAIPVFDRQLSLSTNNQRDGGMQAYISVNGGPAPNTPQTTAKAINDAYTVVAGNALTIADPNKGVIANDIGVYGVALNGAAKPTHGTVTLNGDGTFIYTPDNNWTATTTDSFTYVANGKAGLTAVVTLTSCAGTCKGGAPTVANNSFTSTVASYFKSAPPGVLTGAVDPQNHPLTATITAVAGGTATLNPDGSFSAMPTTPPSGTTSSAQMTITFTATNSQGTKSSNIGTATVNFLGGSGLSVNVADAPVGQVGKKGLAISDYRWIIEEDRTFQVNPAQETGATGTVPNLGVNFHTSYMPVVASGCTGSVSCESGQTQGGKPVVCDVGNGACRPDAAQLFPTKPSDVNLNPLKHYYISILPGDAGNTFSTGSGAPVGNRPFDITLDCGPYTGASGQWAVGTGKCGHGMGGAQVTPTQIAAPGSNPVNILLQETPYRPSKVSILVYEDDFPLNGENDAGGGMDVLAPYEPGLGGFEVRMWDSAGGSGDSTGQMTYDMFNMPLSNSLAGTIDPVNGNNACPITKAGDNITGRVVTCPRYESDGKTLSPLAGQAIIANLMPGRYGIQANPGADRAGHGEEWLQTNTLDGQKAHDAFIKVGGPSYFQEYGPAGFHVSIGFANPAIINGRLAGVCGGTDINITGTNCTNTVTGTITGMRQSHGPDQRLYSSGTNDDLSFTQCYVSLGDPDGEDFAFAKCDPSGKFTLTGIPDGTWRITAFDQWNDQIVDGLSTPVRVSGGKGFNFDAAPGNGLSVQQWHTNVATTTFIDSNGNGVRDPGEEGLPLIPTNVRYRDGSFSNFNTTDLDGYANFNEVFPLFNWYTIETDSRRFKNTGTHVIYDAGGPATTKGIAANLAGTTETSFLPAALRFPGSVYCKDGDCTGYSIANGPASSTPATQGSTSSGRIDPPWVFSEGWQGFIGQYEFLEFGKTPFAANENGGISGEVVYASTRPFDDPSLLIHTSWEPNVPNVTVNLYQETAAADGTTSLQLVDHTKTSSWDDWTTGFRSDGIPWMNCPGQKDVNGGDPFYFTLLNTPFYLDQYNSTYNGGTLHSLPNNSQFKCYDGLHNFNQVQPAPYDGMYKFPSVTGRDPVSGKETGTNCAVCKANPTGDGTNMLPAGKYVVEVVVPPGYELVKEEDKNILIGDNYIAPVVQEFGGIGDVFILPDQASVASAYNANNAQNSTNALGLTTSGMTDVVGEANQLWPCVGLARVVPDLISLYPGSGEVAPFAGATRNLCDRKEVTLDLQTSANAKFYIFSSAHVASHFTGFILDDLSAEFDPFSPQFGEKFAVPNLPVSLKDFAGNEVERVYADQWGTYNGLNYSTWEVNPPNPTGYAPNMMVACMNDPGTGVTPDPFYNPSYSQFCYEWSYMPGQTAYMDTPVVPTAAFAEGYNPPDCNYPDSTPAIASVISSDGAGPWVKASGSTLTINALGKKQVQNPAYSGPQATSSPFNQKFITRNYGFGATQCKAVGSGCSAVSSVTIGGVSAPITGWTDSQITVTVPAGIPACTVQQRSDNLGHTYSAQCGQMVITSGNGQKSIDAITVTVGGKAPTFVGPENTTNNALQQAIDNATPGDLLIVAPGVYQEMVLMWKPVRLQGVGAASVTINANTHPSGKMDPWRRQVECLFGVAISGTLMTPGGSAPNVPYDSSGTYTCTRAMQAAVDPLPYESIFGWDTTLNGNLAEMMQEPSLMGAYEGAGITVLGKGMNMSIDASAGGPNGSAGDFPTGAIPLTNSLKDCNAYPSNYWCNPSRIDGISVMDSSQGGGGIFAHAWNHNLEISNNRVYANAGTLGGGINIGQGETPDPTFNALGVENAFQFETNVTVHNNSVTQNTSYGDELFSSTPAAAGGVNFCTGSDYYHFNYNWVCGNLSTGDGAGFMHVGYSMNGDISHNWFLFNQSNNITIPTNGGGLVVMGAAPDGLTATGQECGNTAADADCAPGLSDGTGPNLVIDSNVIMGNTAESGSGGGIRLELVNGTDVQRMPLLPALWNSVTLTNNIIANNVAGWDGGGISMQDALKVDIINNTITSNDTTASAGVLFDSMGSPNASSPPPGCDPVGAPTSAACSGASITTSTPQPAGLVTMQNTPNLTTAINALPKILGIKIICPIGNSSGVGALLPIPNGDCAKFSYPRLANDMFWENRAFNIQVGAMGGGVLSQQNIVGLVPNISQTATGQCSTSAKYWDIGVRGDQSPSGHESTLTLSPSYSILTAGYSGSGNKNANPNVASQYCNGSQVPPEVGGSNPFGYQVPPGIVDATMPNPVFNLTPGATVDEGNNWINMQYGPLGLANPTLTVGTPSGTPGIANGDYRLTGNSTAAIAAITPGLFSGSAGNYALAPQNDLLGVDRKAMNHVDIGAIQYVAPTIAVVSVAPTSLSFGNVVNGSVSPAQTLTVSNTGAASFTGIAITMTGTNPTGFAQTNTCGTTLAKGASCTISVTFKPTGSSSPTAPSVPYNANVAITGNVAVPGAPVGLTGTGIPPTPPKVTVAPLSLAFGNVVSGTTSPAQTLTLTNSGGTAFTFGTLSFSSARYSRPTGTAGGTCATTLAINANCTINVVFSPNAVSTTAVNATLTINGNATVTPVPLSGTGVGPGTATITFATPFTSTITLPKGTYLGSTVATLTNTSTTAPVTVNSVTFQNITLFYSFTTGNNTCAAGTVLAPGATCTVTLNFGSIIPGTYSTNLTINTNASLNPPAVKITGVRQ